MGLFRYEAIDKTGKVVCGVMNARDEQQVAQNLSGMGYALRAVYASSSGRQPSPPARAKTAASGAIMPSGSGMQSVTLASGVPVSIKSRVPLPQLAIFFRQLATLVRSGIPLYQSFSDLAPATRDSRLKNAIPQMQQTLQVGQPLSSAMAAFPDLFPAHTIASVWCGELAGKLDVMIEEIATDLEFEASDTRLGRVGWGLVKANLIFFILTIPFYNLGNIVGPVLGNTEADFEHSQNLLGFFLGDAARQILHVTLPIALAVIASWIIWGYLKRVPTVRHLLDGILLAVPVWGKLHRYRSLGRFLHLVDELYAAGISPGTVWDAASVGPRNSAIVEKLRLAKSGASGSAGIGDIAAVAMVMEPEDVALISTGERTGQLPETLSRLSSTYAGKAALQKSTARIISISLMNSALIAMSGVTIIIIAKTYITPIAKLIGM